MNLVFKEGERELVFIMLLLLFQKNKNVAVALFMFLVIFFRAPAAKYTNDDCIIAPSYGTVSSVDETELGTKVSILLKVSDVHVQYMPCAGIVKHITHIDGTFNPFFIAAVEKTNNNERMYTTIHTAFGDITVVQYAGMIARRIVNNLSVNDVVAQGDIFGMIKFSSRVDIVFPNSLKTVVRVGDKIVGGSSVIAKQY